MSRTRKAPAGSADKSDDGRFVAIYMRLSHGGRRTALQEADLKRWSDLKRWADGQHREVRWYQEERAGSKAGRPEWERLAADLAAGRACTLVCWRLDRLGKTCSELVKLFEDLGSYGVNLVSLKDHFDLSTPSGRRMADVLASVAVYETELRAERILAGQEAARARGVRWGGSPKGRNAKVTAEQEATVKRLRAEGMKIARIARETGLSRPTIYKILGGQAPPEGEE